MFALCQDQLLVAPILTQEVGLCIAWHLLCDWTACCEDSADPRCWARALAAPRRNHRRRAPKSSELLPVSLCLCVILCPYPLPTLGAILRIIKAFMLLLEKSFSLNITKWSGLNLLALGVHTPQTGVTIPCDESSLHLATRALCSFTMTRPIRVVNDLARPLRN